MKPQSKTKNEQTEMKTSKKIKTNVADVKKALRMKCHRTTMTYWQKL